MLFNRFAVNRHIWTHVSFSDNTHSTASTSTFVFVSTATKNRDSMDNTDCLTEPEKLDCVTLSFVIRTILKDNRLWVNTIYVDNYTSTEAETIHIPENTAPIPRTIGITCLHSCTLQTNLSFIAASFQQSLVFVITNITFKNSSIFVRNLHLNFQNVQFLGSTVRDVTESGDLFGQIELHFFQIKSEQLKLEPGGNSEFIFMEKSFVATVFFAESALINCSVHVKTPQLLFDSKATSYLDTHLMFNVGLVCLSMFQDDVFAGMCTQGVSSLAITATKLTTKFTNCVVKNTAGIRLRKQDSGLLESWIQTTIQNSSFHSNRKMGSGWGLEIFYFPRDVMTSEAHNMITITNSRFVENVGDRVGSVVSFGGAVIIHGPNYASMCNKMFVNIENSTFLNNKAMDGSGAIFLLESCLVTTISNCTFGNTNQRFVAPKGVFLLSHSEVSIDSSTFTTTLKQNSPSLIELNMLSAQAQVKQLTFTLQCLEWYKLSWESKFILGEAKEVKMYCTSCPSAFYVLSDGQFLVSKLTNQSDISVQEKQSKSTDLSCIPCPAGADCPGNDITANPNFWGFKTDLGITMYQCPIDNCCSGNCSAYHECAEHRTGVLCGGCEENYSLSLLSANCVESASCNNPWMWPVVVMALVLYVVWYTFKNDIFDIPVRIAKICETRGQTESVNNMDKGYFGIVTYFVQIKAVMTISNSGESTTSIKHIFDQIDSYIQLGLNFELAHVTSDLCVIPGLTTTQKTIFKLIFLVGLFVFWNILFVSLSLLKHAFVGTNVGKKWVKNVKIKLVCALVEIVKYTYVGFTSLMFYSLVCTSVAGNQIWFYDGSVLCYTEWQFAMIVFGLTFVIPYPLLVYFGMKLLNNKKISNPSFFLASCFPLPVVLYWLTLSHMSSKMKNQQSKQGPIQEAESENTLYDAFKGGFRESEEGTQYWESVQMMRRLLISATILIPDSKIQLCVCFVLCIVFLVHHLCRNPFVHHVSNKSETFSLSLLCGVAAINLLKASYLYGEKDTQGTQVQMLRDLELIEKMLVVWLIAFIILLESVFALFKRRGKQQMPNLEEWYQTHRL